MAFPATCDLPRPPVRHARTWLDPWGLAALWCFSLLAGAWNVGRTSVALVAWGGWGEARLWSALLFALALGLTTPRRVRATSGWLWGALGLALWLLVTLWWADDVAYSQPAVMDILWLVAHVALTWWWLQARTMARAAALWWVLAAAAAVYVALGLAHPPQAGDRLAVLGGGPNVYARIVGLGLLAACAAWRQGWRVPAVLAFAGSAYCLLLSGSRGGMVACGAAMGLWWWATRTEARWQARRLLTWGTLAALPLLAIRGPALVRVLVDRFVVQTVVAGDSSGREQVYAEGLELFARHPWIGAGLGSYGHRYTFAYPHNLYLHLASEGGLPALLLGVVLTIWWWRATAPARRGSTLTQWFAAATTLILCASLFSGNLYDGRLLWCFGLITLTLQGERPAEAFPV